jgi:prefoldin subunit 5
VTAVDIILEQVIELLEARVKNRDNEIKRLQQQVADWKDRYESLLADAQRSEAAFDKAMNEGP